MPGCSKQVVEEFTDPEMQNFEIRANSPNFKRRLCTQDYHASSSGQPLNTRGPCPRPDVLSKLKQTTDIEAIDEIVERVTNGELTTAAELIFALTPYVSDRGAAFREVLEKELGFFRDIVNDTVDRRIQDEADVMMHTQNDIRNKFSSLTRAMTERTISIRRKLDEISPKFDWAQDGRDRAKIMKEVIKPLTRNPGKRKEPKDNPAIAMEKLRHQVFMRGQWLEKELTRLQRENEDLECFLKKFERLAAERKEQESHVTEILSQEKEELERELNLLRKTFRKNLKIIDALYVEHNRCIKPTSQESFVDCYQ